jgi:hypothetical protein
MTLMHEATSTLLLLMTRPPDEQGVPASVRLADFKGSSDPAKVQPGQLRALLRPPNRVINFIHVADEPADVIRELGILLDRPQRRGLLAQVLAQVREGSRTDAMAEVRRNVSRLEQEYPASDFDLEHALERLKPALASAADLAELRRAVTSGPPLTWERLTAIMDPRSPRVGLWDFIRVATDALPAERDSCGGLIAAVTAADWLARSPR